MKVHGQEQHRTQMWAEWAAISLLYPFSSPAAMGLVAIGTGATHSWVAMAPETAWSWGPGFHQLLGKGGACSASAGFLDKLMRKEPSPIEGSAQGHHLFLGCAYTWTLDSPSRWGYNGGSSRDIKLRSQSLDPGGRPGTLPASVFLSLIIKG